MFPHAYVAAAAMSLVHVHLEDASARLERKTEHGWEVACTSGCDRDVPAGTYRLTRETVDPKLEARAMNMPAAPTDSDGVRIVTVGAPFALDPDRNRDVSIRKNG